MPKYSIGGNDDYESTELEKVKKKPNRKISFKKNKTKFQGKLPVTRTAASYNMSDING